jgi:hypothetical protein
MRALFLVTAVAVGLGICGCSKKDADTEQAKEGTAGMMPPVDSTATPIEVVPMSDVPVAPVEGIFIEPYFDEAGTKTEAAVAPGEQIKLFVMATTVEPYPTGAAQLRVELPPGLSVLYTVETDHKLSSIGRHDYSYMVAYECHPPGRFVIVTYVLQAAADFQGGTIRVLPGFLTDNSSFLGFTTCEFVEIIAAGGSATIRKK